MRRLKRDGKVERWRSTLDYWGSEPNQSCNVHLHDYIQYYVVYPKTSSITITITPPLPVPQTDYLVTQSMPIHHHLRLSLRLRLPVPPNPCPLPKQLPKLLLPPLYLLQTNMTPATHHHHHPTIPPKLPPTLLHQPLQHPLNIRHRHTHPARRLHQDPLVVREPPGTHARFCVG